MKDSWYERYDDDSINRSVSHDGDDRHLLTDDEYDERQRICGDCEYLTDKEICRKCGCVQKNKSRIRNVKCPIEKW